MLLRFALVPDNEDMDSLRPPCPSPLGGRFSRGVNRDCLLVDCVRLSLLLVCASSGRCILGSFAITENLSRGAKEKLLSRKFKMDSSAGWLVEVACDGIFRVVEGLLAERLGRRFLE